MSFTLRFTPARGLLTGVALENNDEPAGALPAEEVPEVPEGEVPAAPTDVPADAPAGDATDTPAADAPVVEDAPAADTPAAEVPADPAADVPADVPAEPVAEPAATEAPVDAPVDTPAVDPAADTLGDIPVDSPADAPVDAPVDDVPAADPAAEPALDVPADGAGDVPVDAPVDGVPDAPAVDTPAEAPAGGEEDPIQLDATEDIAAADDLIADDDAGIEQSLNEVAGASNEIQSGSQDVNELNSIADSLENTLEEGGAPAAAIDIANIAVEAAVMRMNGGFKPRRILPALESFGGIRNRSASTKLAIESLRATASSAGERIMAFIHKCIDFLKTLLTKFVDGFGAMKKKLAALAAAAKQGKLVQGGARVAESVANHLKIGGKFSKQAFIKGLNSLRGLIAKISNLLGVGSKTVKSVQLLQGPSAAGAAEGGEDLGFPPIDAGMLGAAVKAFGGKTQEAEEGSVTVTYLEPLPGDATAYVTGPGDHVEGDIAYRAVSSLDINITNLSKEDGNDAFSGEVDERITEQEFAQMIKAMEAAIAQAEGLRASTAQVIDAEATVVKTVGVMSKGEQVQQAAKKWLNAAQSFASRVATSFTRTVSKSVAYIRGVLNAGLQYLSSFIGGGAKEGAPAAAPQAIANEAYHLAQEGFMGGVKGYALGYITMGFANPKMRQQAADVKKQIASTAAQIAKLRGEQVKEGGGGETPDKEQIIKYGFSDFMFAPFKGAAAGSDLQNAQKKLKKLTAELETIVRQGDGKAAKA